MIFSFSENLLTILHLVGIGINLSKLPAKKNDTWVPVPVVRIEIISVGFALCNQFDVTRLGIR